MTLPDQIKLTAFWTYDQYPYTLSGRVKEFSRDGKAAMTEAYGGMSFSYFSLLPDPMGPTLAASLKSLEQEFRAKRAQLNKEMNDKLVDLFGEYNIKHPNLAKDKS